MHMLLLWGKILTSSQCGGSRVLEQYTTSSCTSTANPLLQGQAIV